MVGAGVQAFVLAVALSGAGPDGQPAEESPENHAWAGVLSADGDPGAGTVRLTWTLAADGSAAGAPVRAFEVQQAATEDFADARVRYRGPQRATVLTGLTDGDHWYRVRVHGEEISGPWSRPVRFTVRHHSGTTAAVLFCLGAVVFCTTAGFLWRESRRVQRHPEAEA